ARCPCQREEKDFPLRKRGIEGDFDSKGVLKKHIFQKTKMLKKYFYISVMILLATLGLSPLTALAEEDGQPNPSWIQRVLAESFSWDLRILPYGLIQEPAHSTQNPGNNFLKLPRYTANLEIRPDLRFKTEQVELMVKPRLKLGVDFWQEGTRRSEKQENDDAYINEWLARWKARENLFISYGRENLQWGPSFLFSPSNPFLQDNGRRNPYQEVPGTDFGRIVWIPDNSWTLSFIANTEEGRYKPIGPDPFERIYALKLDYSGRENYGSMIFSQSEYSRNSLGFFGGWTVSDAVLLYGEGVFTRGSRALYPQTDGSPFGGSFQKLHQNDSAINPVFLAGGSYTLETKGTLSLEYAYYGPGLNTDEAGNYYALRRQSAEAFNFGGMLSGLGQKNLGQAVNTGLRFLRKNYVLLQYTQNNIYNRLDLTLRWTQNLDDGSCQFTSLVTYSLGNHLELFSVGTLNGGSKDSEFGSLLDYQWMIGV
ncbi:MAG: hypothetical protein C0407_16640, partial [Desulfobacca sp.]|nr:hypothetical protein [Desulfobacca sp.]